MVNDKLLLNDGSSFLLLNDGSSVLLLNSETATGGVSLEGPQNRFVDLRDLKSDRREDIVGWNMIGDIRRTYKITTSSLIQRKESKRVESKISKISILDGISKITRNSVKESVAKIQRKPKSLVMSTSEYYHKLLNKDKEDSIIKKKRESIRDLFKEYRDL